MQDCLEKQVEVPRELKISLLERKINEGIEEGKKWSLVHGFPECMQELLKFKEKVGLYHVRETPCLHPVGTKKKLHSASQLLH